MPNRKPTRFVWLFLSICGLLNFLGLTGNPSAIALTEDEKNNVSIYQKASLSVVNITSTAVARDFFFAPVPVREAAPGRSLTARAIS